MVQARRDIMATEKTGVFIYGVSEDWSGYSVGTSISKFEVPGSEFTFTGVYKGDSITGHNANNILVYNANVTYSITANSNMCVYDTKVYGLGHAVNLTDGNAEIIDSYFSDSTYAALRIVKAASTVMVSGSTFATSGDVIDNAGALTFKNTNYIGAALKGNGSYILADGATLVFDNASAISVADLTFSGSNTLKFTGTGRVTFAANETFTGVTLQNSDGKAVAVKTGLTIYGSDVNLTNVYLPGLDIIASGTGKGGLSTSISGSNLLLMNQNISASSASATDDLYIYNSYITFNALCDYYGKGFYRGGGTTTVISGSTFSMSATLQGDAGANGAFGFISGGNVVIKDSLFIDNKANSGGGGAFGSTNAGAVIEVSGSTFAKQNDTICVSSGSELTFEKTNYFNASILGAGTYTMADNAKLVFGNSGYDITVAALNFGNGNNITLAGTGKVGFTNTSDFSGVSITVDASKLDAYTLSYTLATGLDSASIDKITIINDDANTWEKSLTDGTLSLTNTNENIITVTNVYGPAANFGNVEVGTAIKGFSPEGCDYIFNGIYKGDIKSGNPQNSLLYKTTISGDVYSNSKVYILDSVVTGSANGVRSHAGSTITICNTLFYGNTYYSFWAREANSFGILSGSTFYNKIYAEKGSITFQDTNYISAAISKAVDGKITLADNAKLVFGNSGYDITVAALNFGNGNNITLAGTGKVEFTNTSDFSGVSITVDASKLDAYTLSYTLATGLDSASVDKITIINDDANTWEKSLTDGTLSLTNTNENIITVTNVYGPAANFGNVEVGEKVSFVAEDGKIFVGSYNGATAPNNCPNSFTYGAVIGEFFTNSTIHVYGSTVTGGVNYGLGVNKHGNANIYNTLFTGNAKAALQVSNQERATATVSGCTFATVNDYINNVNTLTFKDTNYINAQLTGTGTYTLADNAKLVFGNEGYQIGVKKLNFGNNNTLVLSGGHNGVSGNVDFANTNVFTNVDIVVDTDNMTFDKVDKQYQLAYGLVSPKSVTVTGAYKDFWEAYPANSSGNTKARLKDGIADTIVIDALDNGNAKLAVLGKEIETTGADAFALAAKFIKDQGTLTANDLQASGGSGVNINNAAVTLNDVSYSGSAGGNGGVISGNAALTVSGGEFANNTASNNGGAISVSGTQADISGAEFTENTASYSGGAVDVRTSGATNISNAVFTGNIAGQKGGAVFSENVAGHESRELTILNSRFNSNQGTYGGAIRAETGSLVVRDSTFSGNVSSSSGGAMYLENNIAVTISGSTFSGNSSVVGGAISSFIREETLLLDGSTKAVVFDGNVTEDGNGGAIYVRYGKIVMTGDVQFLQSSDTILISDYKEGNYSGTLEISNANVTLNATLNSNFELAESGITVNNSAVTFGNTETINVAAMTFSGSNTLNFNGAVVNFADQNLTGVNISVDGADCYTNTLIATGVSGADAAKFKVTNNKFMTLTLDGTELWLKEIAGTAIAENIFTGNGTTNMGSGKVETFFATKSNESDIATKISGGKVESNLVGGAYVSAGNSAGVNSVELIIGGTAEVAAKVYAGGYLYGNAEDAEAAAKAQLTVKSVNITIDGGAVSTNMYGGAHARQFGNAKVDTVNITITKGNHSRIYAGGWAEKGAVSSVGIANVTISGGSVDYLYGAGANADGKTYVGTTKITIENDAVVNTIFMGGRYGYSWVDNVNLTFAGADKVLNRLSGVSSAGMDYADATVVELETNVTADLIDYVDKFVINEGYTLTANNEFYLGNRIEGGAEPGVTTFDFIAEGEANWTAVAGISDFTNAKFAVNGSEAQLWDGKAAIEIGGYELTYDAKDKTIKLAQIAA